MINEVTTILIIFLIAHFLGDFVFQSHWMAQNKSKNILALLAHVGAYTLVFGGISLLFVGFTSSVAVFIAVNVVIHFGIDFYTSRLTSYLWSEENWHWFFVAIGFDQLLHYLTIFITTDLIIWQHLIQ